MKVVPTFGPGRVLTVFLVVAAGVVAAAQGWREAGVAAFDAVWLTVNETYYDPDFGGLDWASVRRELRPAVEQAESVEEQRAVIRDMLGRLGQSHFALLVAPTVDEQLRGSAGAPFDIRAGEAGLLVTRTHQLPVASDDETRARAGDLLLEIDGVPVDSLIESIDRHDPRYSDLVWRRAMRALSGDEGEVLRLTVQSPGGEPREVVERRVAGPGEMVAVGNLPPMRAYLETEEHHTPAGRRVGVIRFNFWMAAVTEPFAEAVDRFRDHDGIVIDLRGNPGGLADMIRGLAGHLFNEPVVLGRMRMRGLDLEFRANPRRSTTDGRSVVPYQGPVALLVDGLTASASECFAGALQSLGRARVFGTRTSGQALPASTQQLASGDVLLYVVGDFVTATGQRLEGTGVVPDVEVAIDPAELAAGRDALHAALTWMDEPK